MKKMGLWLAAVPLALGLVGCGQSSAGTVSQSSASSSSAAKSSSTVEMKEPKPDFAEGFEQYHLPKEDQGTWYGYAAYTTRLSTITLGNNWVKYSGNGADGKTHLLYDNEVRTDEDKAALSASNGGSASGPNLTAGDKYRRDNWIAAQKYNEAGPGEFTLWTNWYVADAGTLYEVNQKQVGKKTWYELYAPLTGAAYYHDKKMIPDGTKVSTQDDLITLAFVAAHGWTLAQAHHQIVEIGSQLMIRSDGSSVTDDNVTVASVVKLNHGDITLEFERHPVTNQLFSKPKRYAYTVAGLEKKLLVGKESATQLQELRMFLDDRANE